MTFTAYFHELAVGGNTPGLPLTLAGATSISSGAVSALGRSGPPNALEPMVRSFGRIMFIGLCT
jgi:hypothetical protein